MSAAPYLLPDGKRPGSSTWYSVDQMSKLNDIGRDWINARIKGFKSVMAEHPLKPELRPVQFFEPACGIYIREAATKWKKIPVLGTYISLEQACRELPATRGWVLNTLAHYNMPPPQQRRSVNNRIVPAISKLTLKRLKKLRAHCSPDLISLLEAERITGWDATTVERRARKAGLEIVTVVSAASGHLASHVPISVVELIGTRPKIPYAGDFLTAHRMSEIIGRTPEWTQRRLAQAKYRNLSRRMLTDTGEICLHYPPAVCKELRAISDSLRHPLAPLNWKTATDIHLIVGGSREILAEELSRPDIVKLSRLRTSRARAKRVYRFYSPAAVDKAIKRILDRRATARGRRTDLAA